MCEIEEQHAARVEVEGPKRRDTCGIRRNADFARERLAHDELCQEEADEVGFVPSASSEPRGAIYWCDNRGSEKALRPFAKQFMKELKETSGESCTLTTES